MMIREMAAENDCGSHFPVYIFINAYLPFIGDISWKESEKARDYEGCSSNRFV